MTDIVREEEWKAAQTYYPSYMKLWMDAVDQDATEYVYWHGHVPDWWDCEPNGEGKRQDRK